LEKKVRKKFQQILEFAILVIDKLRASRFEIDQNLAILGDLDLKILELRVVVPGL
jgi:hypothetical protein